MKHLILSLLLSILQLVPLSADLVGISGSWYDNFAQTGSWSSLSYAVAEAPNGDLWLATSVTDPNSTAPVARLQRFNGTDWKTMGDGFSSEVRTLYVDDQQIIAGGTYNNGEGVRGAAIWNESTQTWDTMGSIGTTVHVIKKGPDDLLYFGGSRHLYQQHR